MLALNSDRYIEYAFATLWAGGIVNPVNIRWSPAEMAYGLEDSGTRILLFDDAFADAAHDLRGKAGLKTLVHADDGEAPKGSQGYEELIAASRPAEDAMRGGDDLAALLYTGGTTGFPKGVELSHANLYTNALGLTAGMPHAGDAPALHVAPMFHVGGMAAIFQFALRRCPQIVTGPFDPPEILRAIQDEQIGDIFLVPTMLKFLIEHPDFPRYDTSSLRQIRYGAAPIDSTLLNRAMQAFPGVGFMQLYGQTETGPVVSALPPEDHLAGADSARLRSAGRPIPIAEIRIADGDGNDVEAGGVGEVLIRGPSVMRGYRNKPEETAAALRDGWMHTGDAGRMDEDGYLYIVDRVKDMIITGGENVYSAEVENALARLEGVSAWAVIGIPDEKWGGERSRGRRASQWCECDPGRRRASLQGADRRIQVSAQRRIPRRTAVVASRKGAQARAAQRILAGARPAGRLRCP